ncbi:MAG: 2-phosphosulfolactate phosphatase [Mucinivorans sp.]
MRTVEVYGSAAEVTPDRVEGCVAVVIDVFRATSVMCTAMENGARRIIPVTSIQECHELQDKLSPESTLLGGERKTRLIEGFDLDNSPLKYTRQAIEEQTIIMSTTNGTRTINVAQEAAELYIGSLLNARAIVRKVIDTQLNVVIICAGRKNFFTMEDGLCAGLMAGELALEGYHLGDFAWVMADLYIKYKSNLRVALRHCRHYNQIIDGGLADDVAYCLQEDIFKSTPKVIRNENSGYQEILLTT